MSEHDKPVVKRIMIWVGSITAILTLIIGLQQLYTQIETNLEAKNEVDILIKISKLKVDVGDYTQAWEHLQEAEKYDVMEDEIESAKVYAAMSWLQNMRGNESVGSFTDQVKRILLILSKAATRAEGEYLADIYAHMGWADFLRFGEGDFTLKPEIYYEKALTIDADNTYANAMLGHWLSRTHRDADKGWEHLQIAAKTGKHLDYTREMQFAALGFISYNNINYLKMLHDMRLNDENPEDEIVSRVLSSHYYGFGGFERFVNAMRTGEPIETPIAPEDDLALIDWLWQKYPHLIENYQRYKPYIDAILTEATGDTDKAHKMYAELHPGLPDNSLTYHDINEYMQNAINRTRPN